MKRLLLASLIMVTGLGSSSLNALDKIGKVVAVVPKIIGDSQTIIDGSKNLPTELKNKVAVAKALQSKLKAETDKEKQNALALEIAYNMYDATGMLANFAQAVGGMVENFGSIIDVTGPADVANKAKAFASEITTPLKEYLEITSNVTDEIIAMGFDPEQGMSPEDAKKIKEARAAEKAKQAKEMAKVSADITQGTTPASQGTSANYTTAASKLLTMVPHIITLVNTGNKLVGNIKEKVAHLKIKQINFKKAKLKEDDAVAKAILLSMNQDLLSIGSILCKFVTDAVAVIKDLSGVAAAINPKSPTVNKAKVLSANLSSQVSTVSGIITNIKDLMAKNGADDKVGLKVEAPEAEQADDQAQENEEHIGLAELGA